MAETKVLKGINFPGLEGTYYVPEATAVEDENGYIEIKSYVSDTVEIKNLDTTLTKNGCAADAKAVGDALSEKQPKGNYLTSYTETDPTVPAWAKAATKPTYTASEVGADASGAASSAVSAHNTNTSAHSDIRAQITQLSSEKVDKNSIVQTTGDSTTAVMSQKAVTDALAQVTQTAPEFVDSIEQCTDTSKLYVLPDGYIYAWMLTKKEVNSGPAYTNRLPLATDTDGKTIFGGDYNGDGVNDGYQTPLRLSSSGSTSSSVSPMCASGFIPAKDGDVIRIKGAYGKVGTQAYVISYNSSRTKIAHKTIPIDETVSSICWSTVCEWATVKQADDNLLTFTLSSANFGTGIEYIRFSGDMTSGNVIVTVNEEIKEGGGTTIVEEWAWANTGRAFVAGEYEDRIIALETTVKEHDAEIAELQEAVKNIGTNIGADQVALIKNWNAPIYDNAPLFLLPNEKPAMGDSTVAAIYAKYDALMAQHPNYITKTDLGLASDGSTHIYRYDFCEPRARKNQGSTNHPDLAKPKAIIVSGIHIEYAGMYALYYALEEIANNAELYQDLRKNTHLIVVPAMNPYCLDINNYSVSNGRKNANGVEIHRNFEVEHKVVDASSNNYGGATPLSEVESQYVDNIMKNNTDAAFFLTCHNYDYDTYSGTGFIWPSVATNYMYNMGDRLINKMSKAWLDKYGDTFRNGVEAVKTDSIADGDYTIGSVGMSGTPGTETKQALKYGIQGTNVEIAKLFKVMEPNVNTAGSAQVMSRGAEVYINFLRMAFGCYDHKDKKQYFVG